MHQTQGYIMRIALLLILAATSTCFSHPAPGFLQEKELILNKVHTFIDEIRLLVNAELNPSRDTPKSSSEIKALLHNEASTLNTAVIDKVITTLECMKEYKIQWNTILTIIDYSLPSSEKRLWVFDLKENKKSEK